MTQAPAITCPHCGASGQAPGGFCTACGKALPSAVATSPRVLGHNDFGTSTAGRVLRSSELEAKVKRASGAILAVAVVQFISGGFTYAAIVNQLAGRPMPAVGTAVLSAIFGLGVIFLGLFFWARKNPLPAAIVAITVYVTVVLLEGVILPGTLLQGIIFRVVVVVVLIRAIQAGLEYRRITAEPQV